MEIKLGVTVKDKITGFEGVVVGRTQYLYGCKRAAVQSQKLDKDSKPIENQWFDEESLEVIPVAEIKKNADEPPSGPMKDPTRSDPKV